MKTRKNTPNGTFPGPVLLVALGLMLGLVAGCGNDESSGNGNDNGGDNGGTEPGVAQYDNITLHADSLELLTGDSQGVLLIAYVRDDNNVLIEGADVEFSVPDDSGVSLNILRGTTDATGTAQARLTTELDPANRTITAQASSGGESDELAITVTGTELTLSGPNHVPLTTQAEYEVVLRDGQGERVATRANEPVAVSIASDANNTVPAEVLLDANGEATFAFGETAGVDDTLTVSAIGATDSQEIAVSGATFQFLEPGADDAIPVGEDGPVVVEWLDENGVGVENATVSLFSDSAVFSDPTPLTDADGQAVTEFSSELHGPATLEAYSEGEEFVATRKIRFIPAGDPDRIDLQAEPAIVTANPPGSSANRSTLIATVRDQDGVRLEEQRVAFSRADDPTAGSLHDVVVTTDRYGRATTEFIPGDLSSGNQEVTIAAEVVDSQVVATTVDVTVKGEALHITVGAGGTMIDEDEVRYRKPHTIMVTDSAGQPVANQRVDISVWPLRYEEGEMVPTYDQDDEFVGWAKNPTAHEPNEDTDRTGEFTSDKDVNDNCQLDPGNTATVGPADTSVGGVDELANEFVVETDDSGFADFHVVYPQTEALWSFVELSATTVVEQTESQYLRTFWLPILADHVSDEETPPPNQFSPYPLPDVCP